MKIRLVIAILGFCLSAYGQTNINLELLSNVEVGEAGNDIWGYVDSNGIEYAIMGTQNATRIFSLEDKTNPIERAVIPGASSIWRDIKHFDEYLYVTTDQGQDGLLIVDMTQAPDLIEHKFWTPALDAGSGEGILGSCHNLYVDAEEGWCYLAGCSSIGVGGVLILDIHTDPLNPIHVGSTNEFYSHDVVALGDIIYSSEISDGHFSVYDVSDRTNPVRTILQNTTTNFTHNAWPSDDGNFLFTTDERPNAFVDAYDISDPENVQLLDTYQPLETAGNGVIPHNTHYDDGYLVTSWYTDGVVIVDGSRPDNLIKVGAYDTFLGPHGGFSGCWGVYPYLPSGTIIASDINSGLYVFSSTVDRACYLEGNVVDKATGLPVAMATVEMDADQMAFASSDAAGAFKTGLATAGTYMVNVNHPDYLPAQVEVNMVNGEVTNVTIELEKLVEIQFNGSVLKSSDGTPIDGAHVVAISGERRISATSGPDGNFNIALFEESYTIYAGAWGYHEAQRLSFDPNVDTELEFRLDQGYKDDFVVDQGWIVTGDAITGIWERDIPIGTNAQQGPFAPGTDSPTDTFGDFAYVTGNGGSNAGFDDVDDGITVLTSRPMDLTELINPAINFSYWFANAGGNGGPPNDAIVVRLSNGVTTELVEIITESDPQWLDYSINVLSLFNDVSNVILSIEVGDDPDSGHLVEAGIDKFFVDSDVLSTQELSELHVDINPNPFSDLVTLKAENNQLTSYIITDALGQKVLSGALINGSQDINTAQLIPGIYYIQVLGKEQVSKAKKMIKL